MSAIRKKGGARAPKIIPFNALQKPDKASAVGGRLRTRLVANQNKEHLVWHIRLQLIGAILENPKMTPFTPACESLSLIGGTRELVIVSSPFNKS